MRILALDHSTDTCSVALWQDGQIASMSWLVSRSARQQLAIRVDAFLAEQSCAAAEIDRFACGLGPGNFAGLRVSITFLRALALPGGRPLQGLSSGLILAMEAGSEHARTPVVVAGDARRNRVWSASVTVPDDGFPEEVAFRLDPLDALPQLLLGAGLVVSPDMSRIGTQLSRSAPPGALVLEDDRTPSAAVLAAMAAEMQPAVDDPLGTRLRPIYLHPPVFVKPSFPTQSTRA